MNGMSEKLRRERGAVAVEFALILPVLLLILFGIIEFGLVWSQTQVFQGAAREGARCAAVKATSSCDIGQEVVDGTGPYTAAFEDGSTPLNVTIDGVAAPSGCSNATKGHDVSVSWVQPFRIAIPFWNDVTWNSTVQGVFRCE